MRCEYPVRILVARGVCQSELGKLRDNRVGWGLSWWRVSGNADLQGSDCPKQRKSLAMYLPPHFQELNPDIISQIVATAPLACIVAQTSEGLVANHIPVLAKGRDTLIGHVALANDMHRLMADGPPVLAIFRSDHGYISPNYYPTKALHHRHVPTWNYQVVHMHGTISFQHDTRSKRAVVGLLTRHHEQGLNGDAAWRMADAPADYMAQMLDNIVAFQITVTRILAKSKLSQNREPIDGQGAADGVRASGQVALAEHMVQRLADKREG